jgi:N-acetylmuramoyl-L-alanine amidase
VFVSLHFNSHEPEKNGIETSFAPDSAGEPVETDEEKNARISASAALATAIHANSLYKLRSGDGGVRAKNLEVLSGTRMPAVVIEGGYLTHPDEGARIATEVYRERLAEAIAGGIRNFVRATSPGRGNSRSGTPR